MGRPKGSKNKPKMDTDGDQSHIVKRTRAPRGSKTVCPIKTTEDGKVNVEVIHVNEPINDESKKTNVVQLDKNGLRTSDDTDLLHIKNSRSNINKTVKASYAMICQKCQNLKAKKCEGIIPHPNMPEISSCPSFLDEDSFWE